MSTIVIAQVSTGATIVSSATTGIQGPAGPSVAAGAAGQFYVTNAAATAPEWKSLSGDVTDSATTTGQVTVTKVNGATVPAAGALTTGNAAYVSGVSALTYSALNLAGGAGWVTGILPAANQAAQTMAGDVTGTTGAAVVAQAQSGAVVFSSGTTPTIESSTSATSLTVGTNKAGATLALQAGAATTALSLSAASGHALATIGGVGGDFKLVAGPLPGFETSDAGLWALPSAGVPSAANCIFFGDGSNSVFNAPTGFIDFRIADVVGSGLTMDSSGLTLNIASALLTSSPTSTSLTVRTNKSGATLTLEADAATTIQTLASTGTEFANLSTPAAGTGPRVFGSSGALKCVGSSGTITTMGPADLEGFAGHCPCCGTDFAVEWSNEKMGALTVCMNCLAEELGDRPWIVRRPK